MNKKSLALLTATSIATAVLTIPTQSTAAVSVQNYSAPANKTYSMTEDAMLYVAPQDGLWTGRRLFFGAMYNYVNAPLVELNAERTQRLGTVVNGIHTLDMTAGWMITQRASLNLSLPLNMAGVTGNTAQFALGDARLMGKWRLTPDFAWVHVAIIPEMIFPTGAQDLFLSNGGLGGGMRVSVERDFGPIVASVNAGYRYRHNATFQDLNYTHSLPLALGLYVPIGQKFGINGEASGAVSLPFNRFSNPGEVYLGARFHPSREVTLAAGAALGSVNGIGSNDYRVIGGVQFSPMPKEEIPVIVAPAPVMLSAKAELQKQVVFTAKEIQLGQEVKFEHGKDVLTASGKALLDVVADVMKENKDSYKSIVIEGHTNDIGGHKFNNKLSQARAAAVKEYLISRGIDAKVLDTKGYGKTRPKLLPGLSRDAQREANRRVEFKVIQSKKPRAKKSNGTQAQVVKQAS